MIARGCPASVRRSRPSPRRRGASLPELAIAITATAILTALVLPGLATARADAATADSLANLRALGAAHGTYAADWNDRQWTAIADVLGAYGDDASGWPQYNAEQSVWGPHPPITLGWGLMGGEGDPVFFAYRTNVNLVNARLCEPIGFEGPGSQVRNVRFGSFRFPNDARLNAYLGGRFYDPVFYAASDPVVYPVVEPRLDEPFAYVDTPSTPGFGDAPYWSSYVLSAAAMLDPAVMAARTNGPGGPEGGWVDPWSLDTGFRSPAVSQARHPSLKTRMLEHHWLQDAPPDPCNPGAAQRFYPDPRDPEARCEPWYFNHGLASAPATLFFDGSTRLLPNAEALVADEILQRAAGGAGFDGTWSRSTPLAGDGYFNEIALEPIRLSHHVLTADGILGRDTLDPAALDGEGAAAILRRRGLAAATTERARPSAAVDLPGRLAAWLGGEAQSAPRR